MKFWKKSATSSSNRVPKSNNRGPGSIKYNDEYEVFSKQQKRTQKFSTTTFPTRYQRMQLLNSIIHNADAVQNQFLPPKSEGSSAAEISSGSKIMSRSNSAAAAMNQMNDKAYQRWHQVLQEGLVPMAVRGLGLLEKMEGSGECKWNDEEEEYFATLQGMDEDIQVMAVLARAASLHVRHPNSGDAHYINDSLDQSKYYTSSIEPLGQDGMEQINAMMKCTALLMFHIVMMASTPYSDQSTPRSDESTPNFDSDASNIDADINKTTSAAGYDGRVRHVLKMSCVDVLTSAILKSVESYDESQCSGEFQNEDSARDQQSESKLSNVDEGTVWNVPNIKKFVDEHNIGNDAIFGTFWNKKSFEIGGLIGKKQVSKNELQQQDPQEKGSQSGRTNTVSREEENHDVYPSVDEMHSDLLLTSDQESAEHIQNNEVKDDVKVKNQDQHIHDNIPQQQEVEHTAQDGRANEQSNDSEVLKHQSNQKLYPENERELEHEIQLHQEEKTAHLAKRQLNAKFLATRKFELIERIVAIDVVRFLMAEERVRKLREKESKEQKSKFMNVVDLLKKANEEENDNQIDDAVNSDNSAKTANENDLNQDDQIGAAIPSETTSEYWTSHRKKQVLRSLKIAGVGLTLGTVFAVTGGLAAPALAAGLGGLATLTGAGTASSTAILAVLATFKAGAALFGVGGGGIAAYKMKKRTDGLSEFSIRRENIEQYMYQGASEEKMKKGIEAMLPRLHTTAAVSGWLRENDIDDFQLCWGISPNCRDEKSKDDAYRICQLKRFYSVYNPPLVQYCEDFMWHLQRKQKKEFSWEKIWNQLERKYGANPDHILPIEKPFKDEILLSVEERQMIDGVLNRAKVVVEKQRGFLASNDDFNENDDVIEFLGKVSPSKNNARPTIDDDLEASLVEKMEDRMMNEDLTASDQNKDKNEDDCTTEKSSTFINREGGANDNTNNSLGRNESSTDHNDTTNSMTSTTSNAENPQFTDNEALDDNQGDERCPVVWDWTRLYGSDLHTVTWESSMLSSLCHIVENMAMEVSSQATKVALQYSVIGAIISAIALPSALLTASKLIDDPYQIVVIRADEAGKELAKCLLQSDERRPVTLVGFSFGARVIYSCLRELARQQEIWEDERSQGKTGIFPSPKSTEKYQYDREPASLIADVIFIGLPRVIDKTVLTSCRRVTGGRLINCYAKNDWLLSLMFVARGGTPCGTKPILDVPGVENYDVTSLVESHTKYGDAIPNILKVIRFGEP
eukprot:CCRYP_020670-RB/>CCRYP_020670-RB protein AED:0.04 eAED:0.04 QI:330/0.85/0.75/1/0.57/0.5/8/1053/1250